MSPLTERCSEKYGKKLLGKTDMEDALKRLDKLTHEESRMAIAEVLRPTHVINERAREIREQVPTVDDTVASVEDNAAEVIDGAQIIINQASVPPLNASSPFPQSNPEPRKNLNNPTSCRRPDKQHPPFLTPS